MATAPAHPSSFGDYTSVWLLLAYMLKNRDKVGRFLNFGAAHEYKAMKDALKVTTEEQWNTAMASTMLRQR
jgi:hypothetical protein